MQNDLIKAALANEQDGFSPIAETGHVDAYLVAQRDVVAAYAEAFKNYPDDVLDEAVYDSAGGLFDANPDKSDAIALWLADSINNQGKDRQIAFILKENGLDAGENLLRDLEGELGKESASPAI